MKLFPALVVRSATPATGFHRPRAAGHTQVIASPDLLPSPC